MWKMPLRKRSFNGPTFNLPFVAHVVSVLVISNHNSCANREIIKKVKEVRRRVVSNCLRKANWTK